MSLDYNKNNIVLAKNLRTGSTPQERKLWYTFLSKYKLRFQRQKAIGDYIVDFYCHKAKLVVEIDGSQHFTEESILQDSLRTEFLESHNLKVVRFTNRQIDEQFAQVCQHIDFIVNQQLS